MMKNVYYALKKESSRTLVAVYRSLKYAVESSPLAMHESERYYRICDILPEFADDTRTVYGYIINDNVEDEPFSLDDEVWDGYTAAYYGYNPGDTELTPLHKGTNRVAGFSALRLNNKAYKYLFLLERPANANITRVSEIITPALLAKLAPPPSEEPAIEEPQEKKKPIKPFKELVFHNHKR